MSVLERVQRKLFGESVNPAAFDAERTKLAADLARLDAQRADVKAGLDAVASAEDQETIRRAQEAIEAGREAAERERQRLSAANSERRVQLVKEGRAKLDDLLKQRAESLSAAERAADRFLDMEREARRLWIDVLNATGKARATIREIEAQHAELTALGAKDLPDLTQCKVIEETAFMSKIGRGLSSVIRETPVRDILGAVLPAVMKRAEAWRR